MARRYEAAQVVVAVRLVVNQRAAALGGNDGIERQHVANVIVAATLAEEGLALPRHGRAFRQGALDAVIAVGRAKERVGGSLGFGAGAAQRETRQLSIVGVADLAHQEIDGIGCRGRAEVSRLRPPRNTLLRCFPCSKSNSLAGVCLYISFLERIHSRTCTSCRMRALCLRKRIIKRINASPSKKMATLPPVSNPSLRLFIPSMTGKMK
jgi:hypothetical protein